MIKGVISLAVCLLLINHGNCQLVFNGLTAAAERSFSKGFDHVPTLAVVSEDENDVKFYVQLMEATKSVELEALVQTITDEALRAFEVIDQEYECNA